jgi:mannose-6-phosphate isomerase-like protein (cupin superfamily)
MDNPNHGEVLTFQLSDLELSPTAALFEGKARAGVDISIFVVRTPPGRAVEMHVHPYPETFVLLAGHGRWTAGEAVRELAADQMIVVPANTPHGFRNVGEEPLLLVSVHESGVLQQTFLGVEPE